MRRFTEYLKQWKASSSNNIEDEYKISNECCLFHDISELSNFTNTEDDDLED